VVHVPLTQDWPAAHAWPHAPQLCTSETSVTHAPAQFTSPAAHRTVQWPLLHTLPAAQRWPHLPQL
jgi:hypothetical protein